MAASGKPKQVVIDALVLACTNSPLREVVGTDALRSVLDFEWRNLTEGGTFNLQLVWETFESQPGFDPEVAAAPICRFKSWENQLGMPIDLPMALRNLSEGELQTHAGRCEVPRQKLQRVLRGDVEPVVEEVAPRRPEPRETVPPAAPPAARRRRVLTISIGAIAVLTLAFAAFQVYRGLSSTAQWSSLATESFAGPLPIANAKRFGDQVQARLTSASWLEQSRETRETQLAQALESLAPRGVTVLFLKDDSGKTRAIAQRWGSPPRIRYVFR